MKTTRQRKRGRPSLGPREAFLVKFRPETTQARPRAGRDPGRHRAADLRGGDRPVAGAAGRGRRGPGLRRRARSASARGRDARPGPARRREAATFMMTRASASGARRAERGRLRQLGVGRRRARRRRRGGLTIRAFQEAYKPGSEDASRRKRALRRWAEQVARERRRSPRLTNTEFGGRERHRGRRRRG